MQEKPKIEELIADSMATLLVKSEKLPKNERLAITQEFREWLNGSYKVEDVMILDTRIK